MISHIQNRICHWLGYLGRLNSQAIYSSIESEMVSPDREDLEPILEDMVKAGTIKKIVLLSYKGYELREFFDDFSKVPMYIHFRDRLGTVSIDDCNVELHYTHADWIAKEKLAKDEICEFLKTHDNMDGRVIRTRCELEDIGRGDQFEPLMDELCREGVVYKTFMVVDREENVACFDSLVEIPDVLENYGVREDEDPSFRTKDAKIVIHYCHLEYKPEDPEVAYWRHPPFVYKKEHYDYVMENFDCYALTWTGSEWEPQDRECLQPGDIWKPGDMDAPSDEMLVEAQEVRQEARKSK